MNIKRLQQQMTRVKVAIVSGCLLIAGSPVMAQTLPVKRQAPNYMDLLRMTADSVLRLPVEKNAREYYFRVTRTIYSEALVITKTEAAHQNGTVNAAFVQTMLQLITKLRNDLKPPRVNQPTLPVSTFIQRNTDAALGNFRRYQQPVGLDRERQYLWVMNQVFENLNQINIGYLQAGLTPEEKKHVWQRLQVQQQIASQLRSKYEP
ncbi:hypothetical protein DIU31_022615 [Mucilaginibacter rubeus]|uniref:DUF4142 domain-containing protein n=2 Tax=Mucilaginibacter rubeus TaxID=2027860 RepID=A0A364WRA5_9SPHI|nr:MULTISPECIES: hypothetical protein [Mucilaginibacter]QEM06171.1 hypothetical protein DIU31_022615 [Mucilaginibacter rubeus]QEM13688.1 hypothetical protein DEO27_027970 [Mucilaginibacter rubeus]QEM18753.1 hypothetical protein DIU38_022850 [Mucilaginibacter gossypii]QTE36253.1 hypothetical protein J3L18_24450 [Mucilaginibacter gossypii]QTE44706.1 hypothetical protein J3L19_04875 [Mucilaginibacter rubeus]